MEHKNITFTVEAINKYIREHNISDFRIEEMKNETLCLVGSFDLSYYHDIQITITGVSHLTINYYFDVDLLNPAPFTVSFLSEDTAVLSFEDWSAQQTGEIHFENNISFTLVHTVRSSCGTICAEN